MISALEGLAILVGLRTMPTEWIKNEEEILIRAETDSKVCELSLGSWRTRSPAMTIVFREISIECLMRGIEISTTHIQGIKNDEADALSRYPHNKDVNGWVMNKVKKENEIKIDIYHDKFWKQFNDDWINDV